MSERTIKGRHAKETEKALMGRIRKALASLPGVIVWRNNVGVDTAKGVRYGLGVGSADLIGIVTVNGVGVFAAWEVKRPRAVPTAEQRRFLDVVRQNGGISGVVTSVAQAVAMVDGARRG